MERLRELLTRLPMPSGGGGAAPKILGAAGLGVAGLFYGGNSCLFNVEGGHRAVMFHRFGGVQQRVRSEGTHIMIPWFQRPIVYDVRTKPRMIQSMTGSKGARAAPWVIPAHARARERARALRRPPRFRPPLPAQTCRW